MKIKGKRQRCVVSSTGINDRASWANVVRRKKGKVEGRGSGVVKASWKLGQIRPDLAGNGVLGGDLVEGKG